MECEYCFKETDNVELIPKKKGAAYVLKLTPICKGCFEKFKTTAEV